MQLSWRPCTLLNTSDQNLLWSFKNYQENASAVHVPSKAVSYENAKFQFVAEPDFHGPVYASRAIIWRKNLDPVLLYTYYEYSYMQD